MAAAAIAAALSAAPLSIYADTGYVSDAGLSQGSVQAPAHNGVVPNAGQYAYAKDEIAAFCHFGPNTFSGVEWGTDYGKPGNKTATEWMEQLASFDADSYVKMVKDAGFTRLIVTAKHHDGFCIWDSPSTDYDMGSTKNKIDILAELSTACTKYDLDMGLYLSPWDIHDASYGSSDGDPDNYNDFYVGQLKEILGNDTYGNHGKFVEIWMDGAKGSGQDAQVYDFKRWHDTIVAEEGEDCIIFQGGQYADVRWVGNENGLAGDTSWNTVAVNKNWDPASDKMPWDNAEQHDSVVGAKVSVGNPDGTMWLMPEADARITSGWFWHPNMKTPKTLSELSNMYFNSVGHGAPLLLNIPPNTSGTVDAEISQRVAEFGQSIKTSFATDLTRADAASGRAAATAEASSVWKNAAAYGPSQMLDGDDATFWSAESGQGTQSVIINLPQATSFDVVSFEEAIQNGQAIKNFTVSYRNGDSAAWVEYGRGGTVGAKRLVRGGTVRATSIKIEMETHGGRIPQLSEVGVYKASKAFEKPTPIPAGMTTIDNTGAGGMTSAGAWHAESGPQFINGTSQWTAAAGATMSFGFDGTKFLLLGTKDPNHGTMKVRVDGAEPVSVSTTASPRQTSALLFASDTLGDGHHTVTIEVVGDKAIGIDAAAILNNRGAGMLDFAETSITMDEDSTYQLGIRRTGGSAGEAEVTVNFEPGSAVQGDFDTTSQVVKFADGQTEQTVTMRTKRNADGAGAVGDKQFTVTMTPTSPDTLVLGPASTTTVTIRDREQNYTAEKLAEAIATAESACVNTGRFTAPTVAVFEQALVAARAVAAQDAPSADAIFEAMHALEQAQRALEPRGAYTAEDPFAFPTAVGQVRTIEGELAAIHNDPAGDAAGGQTWPMKVVERTGASGGKLVDAFGENDTLSIPFTAERAGTYEVTLTYMSGSMANKLVWADAQQDDPLIKAGEQAAGAADADAFKTVTFTFTVLKPGSSTLVFTGPAAKSPRVDKLDVKLTADGLAAHGAIGAAGTGGTIAPAGFVSLEQGPATFTVTPDAGYRIASVTKAGVPVEVADPASALTVEVTADDAKAGDVEVVALFERVDGGDPDKPVDPDKPTTPETPGTPSDPSTSPGTGNQPAPAPKPAAATGEKAPLPKTGDRALAPIPLAMLAATALAGAAIVRRRVR